MTTAGALVTEAFREGNLIPIGQSAKPAEQAEGLAALNRYMLSVFGMEVGIHLQDWQVPMRQRTGTVSRDFPLLPGATRSLTPVYPLYPPPNSRVIWDGSERHVYFPEWPQDGALMAVVMGSGASGDSPGSLTLDGNGRRIDSQDTVAYDPEFFTPTQWLYRADLGNWLAVQPMAWEAESLFPTQLDDMWICGLSVRLAPRFGKTVAPATIARIREMLTLLRTRYHQSAPTSGGGEQLVPGRESYPQNTLWTQ